jgi:hypothetical protein
MSPDIHSASSAEPVQYPDKGLRDHIVTVVAAGLGVLIVALVAILMGMA